MVLATPFDLHEGHLLGRRPNTVAWASKICAFVNQGFGVCAVSSTLEMRGLWARWVRHNHPDQQVINSGSATLVSWVRMTVQSQTAGQRRQTNGLKEWSISSPLQSVPQKQARWLDAPAAIVLDSQGLGAKMASVP